MAITGDDLTVGSSIKWYHGGTAENETYTVTSTDVTNTYISIPAAGTAEFGSLIVTVDGVITAVLEKTAAGAAPATDTSGTLSFTYTTITEDDVLEMWWIEIGTTGLTQVATSTSVTQSTTPDKKTASIHGQVAKITYLGASVTTVTLDEFAYNQTFVAACVGDLIEGSPAAGKEKLTNAINGFKIIGALVGKVRNAAGTVVYKYILASCQATGFSEDFPSDDAITDKATFDATYFVEVDLS
jgi:hypothetical protein